MPAAGQKCVQMQIYHGLRECNVAKCVFRDASRINTHSCVRFILVPPKSSVQAQAASNSRGFQITNNQTHPVALPCTKDQLVAYADTYVTHNKHIGSTSKPLSSFETLLPSTKQLGQQDGRLLIYCTLNWLLLIYCTLN